MVAFALVGVPIAMLNLLNQFSVLLLLSGADYLKVFATEQLHALVMLYLDMQRQGILIAQIFWGLWLFPLGYLVFKSGFLPRVIGVLLMIGCFGYLIASLTNFLFPAYVAAIEPVHFAPAIAELSMILWLLIRGVNTSRLGPAGVSAAA